MYGPELHYNSESCDYNSKSYRCNLQSRKFEGKMGTRYCDREEVLREEESSMDSKMESAAARQVTVTVKSKVLEPQEMEMNGEVRK